AAADSGQRERAGRCDHVGGAAADERGANGGHGVSGLPQRGGRPGRPRRLRGGVGTNLKSTSQKALPGGGAFTFFDGYDRIKRFFAAAGQKGGFPLASCPSGGYNRGAALRRYLVV